MEKVLLESVHLVFEMLRDGGTAEGSNGRALFNDLIQAQKHFTIKGTRGSWDQFAKAATRLRAEIENAEAGRRPRGETAQEAQGRAAADRQKLIERRKPKTSKGGPSGLDKLPGRG